MSTGLDVDRLARAAATLDLLPRGDRWCHLSLCVLDAVFSINATYTTTVRTVRGYAASTKLDPVVAPAAQVAAGRFTSTEQPLSAFLAAEGNHAPDVFAERLGNRQLTSTRSGIRKAEAVQRYARVLVDHDIETLADVALLLADTNQTGAVEKTLGSIPGHGAGIRVSYLWMLAGDDHHIKADRMVLRWISKELGRPVPVAEANSLLVEAARALDVTPWVLDHAVWNAERP